jgi:hypothetical protein
MAVGPACNAPPAASAAPSKSSSSALIQFQTQHQFLEFAVDGDRFVFSGGDRTAPECCPELYTREISAPPETLLARARDPHGSISTIAVSENWVVFSETYQQGATVYRVRARALGSDADLLLDELIAPDEAIARQVRVSIGPPMVAVGDGLAIWSAGQLDGSYRLRAQDLATSKLFALWSAPAFLGYPTVLGHRVLFSNGVVDRTIWAVDPRSSNPPAMLVDDHDVSQPAAFGTRVVMKKGGRDAFDPAGIQLCELAGANASCCVIVPTARLAWQPTVGERYVAWHDEGDVYAVAAYDLQTRTVITLAESPKVGSSRGFFGRAAVFGRTVIWLASPPGGENAQKFPPTFNALRAGT